MRGYCTSVHRVVWQPFEDIPIDVAVLYRSTFGGNCHCWYVANASIDQEESAQWFRLVFVRLFLMTFSSWWSQCQPQTPTSSSMHSNQITIILIANYKFPSFNYSMIGADVTSYDSKGLHTLIESLIRLSADYDIIF